MRVTTFLILLAGALMLAGCGGSKTDDSQAAVTTAATAAPTTDTTTGTTATTADPATKITGGSEDPAVVEWRDRLVTLVHDYNVAWADCQADTATCTANFDTTMAPFLVGDYLATVKTDIAQRANDGIDTRNVEPDQMFYQGFQLYKEKPADAALSLCVVDKAVQYKPATGSGPETIINDNQSSYFVQYRILEGPTGLLIADASATEFVPLEGSYGQCAQYVQ